MAQGPACNVILDEIEKLEPYEFISFSEKRIAKDRVLQLLPELVMFEEFVHDLVLRAYSDQMDAHNATVLRGQKMNLIKNYNAKNLIFASVSWYILQLHSRRLAQGLKALCTFGLRIIPKSASDPHALVWEICDSLLITRENWLQLSQRMRWISALLRHVLDAPYSAEWLERHLLEHACSQIASVFGAEPQQVSVHPMRNDAIQSIRPENRRAHQIANRSPLAGAFLMRDVTPMDKRRRRL